MIIQVNIYLYSSKIAYGWHKISYTKNLFQQSLAVKVFETYVFVFVVGGEDNTIAIQCSLIFSSFFTEKGKYLVSLQFFLAKLCRYSSNRYVQVEFDSNTKSAAWEN